MSTGILYNVFICLVSGFTSLVVFRLLRKIRREKKIEYSEGLDYFSLLFGLVWISEGMGNFFIWSNLPNLKVFIYKWITGPLTYIHLIPAFNYIGWSFFKKKKKIHFLFNGFFTCMILLGIFILFKYGFARPEPTYWGSNITINDLSNKFLLYALSLPAFICIIIEIVRRFKSWKQTRNLIERQLFGFSIGFLIYALTGTADALSGVEGWAVPLIRIGTMIVPLVFYLSAAWED